MRDFVHDFDYANDEQRKHLVPLLFDLQDLARTEERFILGECEDEGYYHENYVPIDFLSIKDKVVSLKEQAILCINNVKFTDSCTSKYTIK